MVKGYEFAKDRYVTFTPEELKALEEKASQQIENRGVVPSDKIDPVYFDKAYYLGPRRAPTAPTGCCRSDASQREDRLGPLRRPRQAVPGPDPAASEGGLVMQNLMYADESAPVLEVGVEPAEVKDQELALAQADSSSRSPPTSSSRRSTKTTCASACRSRSSARSKGRRSRSTSRRSRRPRSSI